MAGHSKWHSIRHKKAANDAKRGKVLTKHSKLLSVIAKNDPNPETNVALKNAIINAKADSVPNDNIDRILRKAAGTGKDAVIYTEQVYEGFGPEGIPLVITALTDNNNRTFPEIRTFFSKNGGNLGTPGSVMFQFDHLGVILIKTNGKSEDEIMELCMEVEAQDFNYHEEESEILCPFADLGKVRDAIIAKKTEVIKAEPQYRAKDPQEISDSDVLKKIEDFIEKIEEIEDILDVFAGFIPSE